MSERRSNKKPRVLWILMCRGAEGWKPSMDHFCAWQTKKAALRKIRSLRGSMIAYKPFKYVIATTEKGEEAL